MLFRDVTVCHLFQSCDIFALFFVLHGHKGWIGGGGVGNKTADRAV